MVWICFLSRIFTVTLELGSLCTDCVSYDLLVLPSFRALCLRCHGQHIATGS